MAFIDNIKGISTMIGMEGDDLKMTMNNIHIHGEIDQTPDGCWDREGLWTSGAMKDPKDLHPTMASALPIYKTHSAASWGSKVLFTDMFFHNWQSNKTVCGARQSIFGNNIGFSDYVAKQMFERVTFENVAQDAMAYLFDPPKKWINVTDCGNFECTGPRNLLFDFKYALYKGSPQPDSSSPSF